MPSETVTSNPGTAASFFETVKIAFSKLAWADVLYAAVLFIVCYIASKFLLRLFHSALSRSRISENLRLFFEKALRSSRTSCGSLQSPIWPRNVFRSVSQPAAGTLTP